MFITMNNRDQVSKINKGEILRTIFPKSSGRTQGAEGKGTWDFRCKNQAEPGSACGWHVALGQVLTAMPAF